MSNLYIAGIKKRAFIEYLELWRELLKQTSETMTVEINICRSSLWVSDVLNSWEKKKIPVIVVLLIKHYVKF